MAEKKWHSFLIPGLGFVDAMVDPEELNSDAGWVEAENITRVIPTPTPQGLRINVEKMYEKNNLNMRAIAFFEKTEHKKIKILSETWGKVAPFTNEDMPQNNGRFKLD